jgi:hypothetical protein
LACQINWFSGVLTDKICSNLYKKYKKETRHKLWQLSEAMTSISEKSQTKLITFKAKPDLKLIIKSILKHFTYLKFQNSFKGIDNYNFASS